MDKNQPQKGHASKGTDRREPSESEVPKEELEKLSREKMGYIKDFMGSEELIKKAQLEMKRIDQQNQQVTASHEKHLEELAQQQFANHDKSLQHLILAGAQKGLSPEQLQAYVDIYSQGMSAFAPQLTRGAHAEPHASKMLGGTK